MSMLERIEITQDQVEMVRDRLDQARNALDHVEDVVDGVDDALQIADELLDHAARITRSSKRWVPVIAIGAGVLIGVAVGGWLLQRRAAARAEDD